MSTATAKKPRAWEAPKPAPVVSAIATAAADILANSAPATNNNYAGIIDDYARIDAQIKALEKSKKTLGEQIKALGVGEHNGTKCKAVVSSYPTTRLDSDAIRAAFDADVIAKFEKTSTTVKLDIKALV